MAKSVERGLGGKEKKEEFNILKKILAVMQEGHDILSAKPIVYLCNLSEKNYILRKDPM